MSNQPNTPEEGRPLQHNEEPVRVVKVVRCRRCRKRAPWCSCGAADYDDLPASDEIVSDDGA